MSSPKSLAAVTTALQYLLDDATPGVTVTVQPPSTVRSSGEQLNIFLYSVYYNPAFRNEPMPGKGKNGESAFPPMPLILKYLITAYGAEDNDISGQILMGKAMSILHDHPVLSRSELQSITFGTPPEDTGLHQQFERIRITPDTLSLDDMSKLWSSFQSAEYRLSIGYEVSVVLIESTRTANAPLPVLKRGEQDRGAQTVPGPQPSLTGLRFPHQKPAAELGGIVTLLGKHLTPENTTVRFYHPFFEKEADPPHDDDQYRYLDLLETETGMTVQIPQPDDTSEQGKRWPAGWYTLCLQREYPVSGTDPEKKIKWTSNELSMPVAPTLLSVAPLTVQVDVAFELTIICTPPIRPEQKTVLLFRDQVVPYDSLEEGTVTSDDPILRSILKFTVKKMPAKLEPYTVVVRLRVDGVDSIPVDFSE
ncbi:MAG: DUF4255 domain-containing protein, partial [Candidatus Electrothrix sp. AUS1_2]|nr:DUF4255 domain-containing protein [Candidatus Electrothrix sp. AUS1_2]